LVHCIICLNVCQSLFYSPLPHPAGLLELGLDFQQVMPLQPAVIALALFAPVKTPLSAPAFIELLNGQNTLSSMEAAATPLGLFGFLDFHDYSSIK
jgi:hypothetical protein